MPDSKTINQMAIFFLNLFTLKLFIEYLYSNLKLYRIFLVEIIQFALIGIDLLIFLILLLISSIVPFVVINAISIIMSTMMIKSRQRTISLI